MGKGHDGVGGWIGINDWLIRGVLYEVGFSTCGILNASVEGSIVLQLSAYAITRLSSTLH